MIITLKRVKELTSPFTETAARFEKLFGESVEVTEALCVEHHNQFDWLCVEQCFLPESAQEEYDKAEAIADAEYAEAIARGDHKATALEKHMKAEAAAFGRIAERLK